MSRQLVLLFSVGEKAARVNAEIVFARDAAPKLRRVTLAEPSHSTTTLRHREE